MAHPDSQQTTASSEGTQPEAARRSRAQTNSTRLQASAAERFAKAVWGPLLGLAVNLALLVVKAIGGVLSGSAALLADAGHSGADAANNLLVLASLVYSRRPADLTHPYGHDRAEVLAAVASSFLLGGAALFFGWDSIQKVIEGTPTPTPLALYVAIATLFVKLIVVRVEGAIAHDVVSQAVAADARDSLADVLSSIAVIIGVIAARLGHPRMDGVAGIVIALLILYTGIQIGGAATHELLEHNIDAALVERVREAAMRVEGVREVTSVTGRGHGSDVLVEMSIQVDPAMTVGQAALLAERVRETVYDAAPEVGDAMVEFNTDHLARLWSRFT